MYTTLNTSKCTYLCLYLFAIAFHLKMPVLVCTSIGSTCTLSTVHSFLLKITDDCRC